MAGAWGDVTVAVKYHCEVPMQPDLNALGAFREHFARYLYYSENHRGDSEILKVSFQFLTNNQESQVAEVVGLVENHDNPEFTKH